MGQSKWWDSPDILGNEPRDFQKMKTRNMAPEKEKKLLKAFELISAGKSFRETACELGLKKSTIARSDTNSNAPF